MIAFVVINNNGELYEDYEKWISGVCDDFETAVEIGKDNTPARSDCFSIEKWDIETGKRLKIFGFEKILSWSQE